MKRGSIAICGLFLDPSSVEFAKKKLRASGFRDSEIVSLKPKRQDRSSRSQKFTLTPQSASPYGNARKSKRDSTASLTGTSSFLIPGLGVLVAARPLISELEREKLGNHTTNGAVADVLREWGVPERDIKRYEEQVKEGNYFISVHAVSDKQCKRATRAMKDAGAIRIGVLDDRTSERRNEKRREDLDSKSAPRGKMVQIKPKRAAPWSLFDKLPIAKKT